MKERATAVKHRLQKAVGVGFTTAVVVATLWLVGAIGWAAALFGIEWPWLKSPIGAGR